MHDRDDDDITTPTAKPAETEPVKELKTVAFLLNGLYKQLADERDTITMASGQIVHATKQFGAYIGRFEEFDKALKKHFVETIYKESQQTAKTVASNVGEAVAKAATAQVEAVTENLQKAAVQAQQQLFHYQCSQENESKWRWITMLVVGVVSGLFCAVMMHLYFPEHTFTRQELVQMQNGKTLAAAWGKLSKKERERILALAKDKEPS